MRYIYISMVVLLIISVLACSKTTEPNRDEVPPNLEFFLGIYQVDNTLCPPAASYYINPRASSDNYSAYSDLLLRWDYESDGIWDTEFEEVDSVLGYFPDPIPQSEWVVTGELRDEAGNSTVETVSLQLPEWMPTLPDVVAGEIRITTRDSHSSSVDTLHIGEEFTISLGRRDWVNEPDAAVTQRYYIDGNFITLGTGQTYYPYTNTCHWSGYVIRDGLQEMGPHEIVVVAELNQGGAESNLENNSASKIVFVVK